MHDILFQRILIGKYCLRQIYHLDHSRSFTEIFSNVDTVDIICGLYNKIKIPMLIINKDTDLVKLAEKVKIIISFM